MELLQLKYFQKVAELESITEAARYFSIPQPSMSQVILRLERDLNVKLFERRNGKLFLNEKGKTFLASVEKMLRELDNGVASVTGDSDRISGPVSIKVMENHRLVLTCVPTFLKQYPEVKFTISHGYHDEKDGEYDLCISSETTFQNLKESSPLLNERLILAVHEEHPLASRKSVRISDLQGESLISMPDIASILSPRLSAEFSFDELTVTFASLILMPKTSPPGMRYSL